MRPRTQIAIPEPKGTEFENFDRLAGILMRVKPKKKSAAKRKAAMDGKKRKRIGAMVATQII